MTEEKTHILRPDLAGELSTGPKPMIGNAGGEKVKMRRAWAMPSSDTFDVPDIAAFVRSYLHNSKVSIDPFARNKRWATYTNDLDPNTSAVNHEDAAEWLQALRWLHVKADLVLFDPPYSPRQISECYAIAGKTATMKDTQNGAFYRWCRDQIASIVTDDGIVLSFGWNSAGMGKERGFEIEEILLVCHGAAHNDTICIAERRRTTLEHPALFTEEADQCRQ